jgi:hypothetical protein
MSNEWRVLVLVMAPSSHPFAFLVYALARAINLHIAHPMVRPVDASEKDETTSRRGLRSPVKREN